MSDPKPPRRPFRTRWSVVAFMVIAALVAIAVMRWQMDDGGVPEETDTGSPVFAAYTGARMGQ